MVLNEEFLEKNGIDANNNINLQAYNIIIGENGAGKTRLLKAIKENCLSSNNPVIYAYFPDMKSTFRHKSTIAKNDIPLYEFILNNREIKLDTFVQYIEQHEINFLNDLLMDLNRFSAYSNSRIGKRANNVQDELNKILSKLINRSLNFDKKITVSSSAYGNLEPLEKSLKNMSPGELSLFYLSILLIMLKENRSAAKRKTILLLDEPELHLHPKALIQFLDYLRSDDCEIEMCCIATHSIFLVPLFEFNQIIYIKNGIVQPANSALYDNLFNDIIGINENLNDFLISRDSWQYYQFIIECFCHPEFVDKVNIKDEQFLKFIKYMNILNQSQASIKVLDYGAGGGRLGKTLNLLAQTQPSIKEKISYFYYDKYCSKPDDLEVPSFDSFQHIKESNTKFHCVVLMNVLHEINVIEWERTIKEIYGILESNGYLLIFEVHALLHGEQPWGDSGYLLLRAKQIGQLFSIHNVQEIELDHTGKTSLFVIPKDALNNISSRSVTNAIVSLKNDLYIELKNLYLTRIKMASEKKSATLTTAKKYGFLSQHYLNSIFALELLLKEESVASTIPSSTISPIDEIMRMVNYGSYKNHINILHEKILEFHSEKDSEIMKNYLLNGTFHQRKLARFYFNNINNVR